MSKIFEALRKTEGAIRNLAAPVLSQDNSPDVPSVDEIQQGEETQPFVTMEACGEIRTETIDVAGHAPVLPFDGTDSRAAEQYRIIRTKILHHPAQPRMLMVSSPTPGDGKTLTAINLAGALALQEGVNVLLVDGDFRRSSLAESMGLRGSPGLGEILKGSSSLEQALIRTKQIPNLYVLPSGDASTDNPAELLASERWRTVVDVFRREFSYIVFDAPPVAAVADYDLLQLACDGVVLVVRLDHTNRRLCQRALDIVPKAKQLGVVLNCVEDWFLWKTQSYYYYGNSSRE
jgi:capsular exopolysaccharide synthesis family protein